MKRKGRKARGRLRAEIRSWKAVWLLAALMAASIALVCLLAPHLAAQGCAMCYQNAAASGGQGRAALRRGILILLVPALSLFSGIFALIYYRRNLPR
jgi:hypothetical protein